MKNPLLSAVQTPDLSNFAQMVAAFKTAGNPMAQLQKDPRFASVMQLCNGRDPRTVFIEECKRRGLDPDTTISQMGLK